MRYFLAPDCALKWLEVPAVYNTRTDELYELDGSAFEFLRGCSEGKGCSIEGCDREFIEYAVQEGILTHLRPGTKRAFVRKSAEPSLRYLELQITTRCNLRCRHCYIGPPEETELPLEKVERVLAEFEGMQGLRLLITGGEALLHRNFPQINDLLSRYAFRKILFTNGILLGREMLPSLGVEEIQVSVDGLENGHDALRGPGTFKMALKGITAAREAGFDVSVSTMVHSRNLGDFDGMEQLFRTLGIKGWSVDVPCAEGNMRDNPLLHLEPEAAGQYLRYGFGEGLHCGSHGFACGLHLASVLSDGKIAKCAFYRSSPVGNVDEGLDVCWSRIRPVPLDQLECDCSERETCRGGCRYRAGLLGNPLGKDLYRCVAFGQEAEAQAG
jgi:radical SAM protein with 4Fe4S-binding SPASM domain